MFQGSNTEQADPLFTGGARDWGLFCNTLSELDSGLLWLSQNPPGVGSSAWDLLIESREASNERSESAKTHCRPCPFSSFIYIESNRNTGKLKDWTQA